MVFSVMLFEKGPNYMPTCLKVSYLLIVNMISLVNVLWLEKNCITTFSVARWDI